MSQTVTISDTLYARLKAEADKRGLSNVEELLEAVVTPDAELLRRQASVRRVEALREHLYSKYGDMPDSAMLVRADRDR